MTKIKLAEFLPNKKTIKPAIVVEAPNTCVYVTHSYEDWEGAPFGYILRKYTVPGCNKKKRPEGTRDWKKCPYCGKDIVRKSVRDKHT